MKRSTFWPAAVALVGTMAMPVMAQEMLGREKPDIAIAGTVVMRIREGAGGYTPEQRAAAIRERLVPILSINRLHPTDVYVRVPRNEQYATIWVQDHLLVTVGEPLARANNTTPAALARAWAENLRDTLPKMSVKPPQQTTRRNNEGHPLAIMAKDFRFYPERIRARAGERLRLVLNNNGAAPHNIEFELPAGEVEFEKNIAPGRSGTLTFSAPSKPGSYIFYCPVGNHKQRGMKGTLVVTGASQQ